ncbi:short-chain dehydrogenase TIC 32, chloroplastic isoform X2 [Ziziphus jujuba]|uniref:Short-chain dehydrogenase TIC 32, chloroplastic isoform X2 n=1 Tax=Ziziphus jujuba TaxID=326968 RepID=A0A6P6GLM9_ZIZJJ|nr:short-chain dehydrogenase TIC 32, chloroplastic isoform X2 [Ziziphus jujuba]
MWLFGRKGPSGFSASSTAEEVTEGIDGTGLTAIVTDRFFNHPQFGKDDESFLHLEDVSVTAGASSGIGMETARVLALRGVHVVMGVRNMEGGREVQATIVKENPAAKINAMELDLSSMVSVRKFAADYNSLRLPLNILINNAGIMATPFTLSKDKIELQFATNHLGHFLLTNLLLETMKKTASESNKEGRIVNVSSRRHKISYPEGIRFDKLNEQSGYNGFSAYGQSKLANVLHANELARQLKEEGVNLTANSLHPGAIPTNLLRHNSFIGGIVNTFGKLVTKNIQQGAATTCYVALHSQVKAVSGSYFADSNIAEASAQANDVELARKLWDFSFDLIKRGGPVS